MAETNAPAAAARKRWPWDRVVLLSILALLLIALAIEMMARSKSQAAFEAVDSALNQAGEKQGGAKLASGDVQRMLGREPDSTSEMPPIVTTIQGERKERAFVVEEFHWQGALGKQILYVVYVPGERPVVIDVTLNQPPGKPGPAS